MSRTQPKGNRVPRPVARLQGKTDLSLIHLLRTNADFMNFDALRDGKVDPVRIVLMSEYLGELERRYPR